MMKSRLLLIGVSAISLFVSQDVYAEYKENYIGEIETYEAAYEDTLVHLARRHDLGFVELRSANPMLDPWIPGEGAEVVLPKRHLLPDAPREGIVINLAEMRLYAYLNGDEAPSTFPLGIGREGLDTPMGETTVIRKKEGPTWRPTQRMRDEDPKLPAVVPPGPDNPLGTHAVYLGWPTYAIHGTARPYGIGRRVSSGCIRMYPEDIIKFFEKVPVGTKVNVIHQPIKVAWIGNELFLEAHSTMDDAIKMEETGTVSHRKMSEDEVELVMKVAGEHKDLLNWPRIREAVRERSGFPVRIARYFDEDQAIEEASEDKAEDMGADSADKIGEVVPQEKPEMKIVSDEVAEEAIEAVVDEAKDTEMSGELSVEEEKASAEADAIAADKVETN